MSTFFNFSYPYIVHKVLFWGQIFEIEIFKNLYVLMSPKSENHIFRVWSKCMCVCVSERVTGRVSVCLYVCLCVYLSKCQIDTAY